MAKDKLPSDQSVLKSESEARAQAHAVRALPGDPGSKGAQPSNTAPANCIDHCSNVLRLGVDSVYLSFQGKLLENCENKIQELKVLAQSDDLAERSAAVYESKDSRFQVLPTGMARFAYVLKDGRFNIRLSSSEAQKMPLASVQVSSKALTDAGMEQCVEELQVFLRSIGAVESIKVSRIDLCCDFVSDVPFGVMPELAWISRSNKRNWYTEAGRFTGFVFGQGSDMSARLYDKTLQILKSKQEYLRDIWWMNGWDQHSTVWRLEFQMRRSVLVELGLIHYVDVQQRLDSLWQYATQNWLRLVCPGKDQTRSRWPNHPLWDDIQKARLTDEDLVPLNRNHSRRVPLDRYFFVNGLAPITSFMAANEIRTFKEAGKKFLKAAEEYHDKLSILTGEDIEEYCQKRAAIKARDYCTRFPFTEVKRDPDYRKGKGK